MYREEQGDDLVAGRVFAASVVTANIDVIRSGTQLGHEVVIGMNTKPDRDEMQRFTCRVKATPENSTTYEHDDREGGTCTERSHELAFEGEHQWVRGDRRARFRWELPVVNGVVHVLGVHDKSSSAEIQTSFHGSGSTFGRPMHNVIRIAP